MGGDGGLGGLMGMLGGGGGGMDGMFGPGGGGMDGGGDEMEQMMKYIPPLAPSQSSQLPPSAFTCPPPSLRLMFSDSLSV